MKFSWKIDNGPMNKRFDFGADPDPDPYRDTGKTCLGGGMHCPSSSSFYVFSFCFGLMSSNH